MMMFTPWTLVPWLKTNFPLEWCHAHHKEQQTEARAQLPPAEMGSAPRRSKLASGQAVVAV
jgi:hypothetical protein